MANYDILYTTRDDVFGYCKIIAVKTEGSEWGDGEINNDNFSLVTLDLTPEQLSDVNFNRVCMPSQSQMSSGKMTLGGEGVQSNPLIATDPEYHFLVNSIVGGV